MYSNYRSEPDYPAALRLLNHLTNDELKDLLNDDEKFEELIKDVKEYKDIETEKEMLMASNRSLAEHNLSREPELIAGKERVAELSAQGEALCQSVIDKITELKQHSGNMPLDTALALLQTSAAESEEESDQVAEKFLEGEDDLENFLDQFTLRRKVMHLRKIKADKMADLLKRPARPTQVSNYFNQAQPSRGSVAPYPVNMHMPMPGLYGPAYS